MTYSRTLLSPSRVMVGDCCALVNEVFEGTKRKNLTSLLSALHHNTVRLYVPRHVLDELLRHIPADAQTRKPPLDPALAMERWNTLYAPHVRVVDVPNWWGRTDARVRAVDGRHCTDTPFAQLVTTIGPCWVLTEDPDLIENQLGNYDRLPMLFAAANDAELGYVETAVLVPTVIGWATLSLAGRGLQRLPGWAQLVLAIGGGAVLYKWHRDGRLGDALGRVGSAASKFGRLVLPPLATILTRHQEGRVVWSDNSITPNPDRDLSELVASVVARAPEGGLLARDIASHLEVDIAQSQLVPIVRDILHDSTAYTEVSRGRWMLGQPATNATSEVSPQMIADWLSRSHRNDPVWEA
jgi:predicted nucleic acid-binding protein